MPFAYAKRLSSLLWPYPLILLTLGQGFSAADPPGPQVGPVAVSFNGRPASARSAQVCGLFMIAQDTGPQIVVAEPAQMCTTDLRKHEEVGLSVPLRHLTGVLALSFKVTVVSGGDAELALTTAGRKPQYRRLKAGKIHLDLSENITREDTTIQLLTRATDHDVTVRWQLLCFSLNGQPLGDLLRFNAPMTDQFPPPLSPTLRPGIEQELIEWDWRMQDGIGTQRAHSTWQAAVDRTIAAGQRLIQDLTRSGVGLQELRDQWNDCLARRARLAQGGPGEQADAWETLWRDLHVLRRRIVLQNPLARTGPLVFVKRVPSDFSHQLTQYASLHARPGGGIYVLKEPGRSMQCQSLTSSLPVGSYLRADVSHDGQQILFAYCRTDDQSELSSSPGEKGYHIYEVKRSGAQLRQLTHGAFDDFSPVYLPDGQIVFLSTRRGGFHRCGRGPCHVHALARMNADGSDVRLISFHETHEWDPCVLHDGRIIYTRWDYVDRHAVHYQQLWAACPDGSNSRIFYGNNTLNPVGVWEARPVPGSQVVMATAGAHHAMTAGSIVLLDTAKGVDFLTPLTRLTPDVLFPESESAVDHWHAPVGVTVQPPLPVEQQRWPGHCYRSPYPLSEKYFLAAYSFDSLIGEPRPNKANMFGLYLVDAFGNKELLYRDLNISSQWPMPLRARRRPSTVASILEPEQAEEGTFFLQDVYASWPNLPKGKDNTIKSLRILQVLPKSTPHANDPRVGHANASPGKQVLGTVPVEADGSAYFRAPAGIPLSFQALDRRGQAVQTMRSLTYLQPGEKASCIGCHEHRSRVPVSQTPALALQRAASRITPGPDGSQPFSYPLLVQPVLDKHCVSCHSGTDAAQGIALTGEPAAGFTVSYNALAPFVSFSEWQGGDFQRSNSEPLTRPGFFGARASKLMSLLLKGHEDVKLTNRETERLVTWMDTNALFYGTFNKQDQLRQQRGERIGGPDLE